MTRDDFWVNEFGNVNVARDFAGREIHRYDDSNQNSPFGWDIDHIRPISQGGTDRLSNLQIVNVKTNDEKGDKFPGFIANGIVWVAKKSPNGNKDYEIFQQNYPKNKS